MNRIYLDYKYSMFGDFSNIQNNLPRFYETLGGSFTTRLENRIINNQPITAYVFEDASSIIVVCGDRLDFVIKANHENSLPYFLSFLEKIGSFFPSFLSRVAFNITLFNENTDLNLFKKNYFGEPRISAFTNTKEFLARKNYSSNEFGLEFNNILTICSDEVMNKDTFARLETILFSIDVNNAPVQPDSQLLPTGELSKYFKYLSNNYLLLLEYASSFLREESANDGAN